MDLTESDKLVAIGAEEQTTAGDPSKEQNELHLFQLCEIQMFIEMRMTDLEVKLNQNRLS